MDLGPHAGFIVIAYAAAIVIVAGLIVWVMLDRRHLTRAVDELEGKGITRRSERARGDAASVEKP
jgi:heme exporter protein D